MGTNWGQRTPGTKILLEVFHGDFSHARRFSVAGEDPSKGVPGPDPNIQLEARGGDMGSINRKRNGPGGCSSRDSRRNRRPFQGHWLDAGVSVVALGEYRGVNKTTGKSMQSAFAHAYWIRDRRIVRFQQYADTLMVAQAMSHAPV